MNEALQWGKPKLFIKDLGTSNAKWKLLPTPIQDSTQLTPTKGDKMEAPIEGGENEAVKYKHNKYELAYGIRKAKGRKPPVPATDGVVKNEYAVLLQPEDETTNGFYIERTAVSYEDPFNANDGGVWNVVHDALAPNSGNTVKWGVVTTATTGEGAQATKTVAFTEDEDMVADDATAVTLAAEEYTE